MYKLIKIISLSILALYCVVFFWKSDLGSSYECGDELCVESTVANNAEGSVESNIKTNTELSIAQVIYKDLSSDHPIIMNYPETDIKIEIDKVEEVKNLLYLSGRYQKELEKATDTTEASYERVALYLNMSKIEILNEGSQEVVFYATPFVANSDGSEVFVYIGLFSYDINTKKSEHLDSELLGERVGEEKITYINDSLKVDYKGYAKGQDFSEYPEEKRVMLLQLDNDLSNFHAIKKMHASWDENADGINDCELENSCDHTVDYSLPR
jgi:hypothetical protein